MNWLALTAVLLTCGVGELAAQNVSKFDVASIKPSPPGRNFDCNTFPGGRFACHNAAVNSLLIIAFADKPLTPQGHAPRIKGTPTWVNDQYDIDAIAEGAGEMTSAQVARPLFALLQERFGLVAHLETVQADGFSLEQEHSGAKLKPNTSDATESQTRMPDGILFTATTMKTLALIVGRTRDVNATVVDNTGLDGKYDFKYLFDFAAFQSQTDGAQQPNGGSSAFDALKELGLRLIPVKIAASVIVVDQIHKPTEN